MFLNSADFAGSKDPLCCASVIIPSEKVLEQPWVQKVYVSVLNAKEGGGGGLHQVFWME